MANRENLFKVAAALQQASRLLLLGHISPDGDSVGSLLALQRILQKRGKEAWVYTGEGIPQNLQFLPGADGALGADDPLPPAIDTVVILDCGEWERTGFDADLFSGALIVNIDHHRTSRGLGHFNYIDSSVAACGQLILHLSDHWLEEIDAHVATCLYTAIASDTGFFQYTNTDRQVHLDAARLLSAQANHNLVVENINSKTDSYFQGVVLTLSRLKRIAGGKAAYSYLLASDLRELGLTAADANGMVNFPRSLTGVQIAAFLLEIEPHVFKVSLRARDCIDVSAIAVGFGGGGHPQAAGCTLQGSIDTCIKILAKTIEKVG